MAIGAGDQVVVPLTLPDLRRDAEARRTEVAGRGDRIKQPIGLSPCRTPMDRGQSNTVTQRITASALA